MLLDSLTDTETPFTPMAAPQNFFASSPAVGIPSNLPNGYFNGDHANAPVSSQLVDGTTNASTPGPSSLATTPGALAGRKRSRGDIHAPDDEEDSLGNGLADTLTSKTRPRGEPVYGSGMTLVYPDDPTYAARAESQSGTWLEDSIQRPQFQLQHLKRPSISSRKSQRVDNSASGPDDLAHLVLPSDMREVTAEPLIDEATRVLGISWVRMDSSEALMINQAAYSKLIQKHYPALKDVSIWFENSAMPCYLVQALNAYSDLWEYFLFSHDLKEARLITTDKNQLVARLKMLPALELAAPGGTMYAVPDPSTSALIDPSSLRSMMAEDDSMIHGGMTNGSCAAHEMEMD